QGSGSAAGTAPGTGSLGLDLAGGRPLRWIAARPLAGDRLRCRVVLQHVQPEAGREIPRPGLHEPELHGESRLRHLRTSLRQAGRQAGRNHEGRPLYRHRCRMPRLMRNGACRPDQQRLPRKHERGKNGRPAAEIALIMDPIKILTANIDKATSTSIDVYIESGGYQAVQTALKMTPDQVIQVVKDSELRGRGGAGFPTGAKWSFVPKNAPKPTYLLCNADESEPVTFKDRLLIEKDPHLMIEGMIITGWAIGSNPMSYIYIRGEFYYGATVLEKALAEARERGYLGKNILGSGFDFDITVARGAGAHVWGEEPGLTESCEGHSGRPRVTPPFPAVVGAFGGPTVVQNVET